MKYKTDEEKMSIAFQEAVIAAEEDEVPIGSAIYLHNELISKNHNRVIQYSDPTAHSEILVLKEASKIINNYRLIDVEIFTTVEPCVMCYGALIHSRIKKLVYGANNLKWGFTNYLNNSIFNHKINIIQNVLGKKCKILIENYFKNKRR